MVASGNAFQVCHADIISMTCNTMAWNFFPCHAECGRLSVNVLHLKLHAQGALHPQVLHTPLTMQPYSRVTVSGAGVADEGGCCCVLHGFRLALCSFLLQHCGSLFHNAFNPASSGYSPFTTAHSQTLPCFQINSPAFLVSIASVLEPQGWSRT